jgi:hypothetical protein
MGNANSGPVFQAAKIVLEIESIEGWMYSKPLRETEQLQAKSSP